MNTLITLVNRLPGGTIYLAFVVLALIPLLIIAALRKHFVTYKQKAVLDDLKKLRAIQSSLVQSWGGEAGINTEIANYYSKLTLMVPASLLSFVYLVLFGITYAHISGAIAGGVPWLSPENLTSTRPVVLAFVGAYLFNLGIIVRRLYVYDLSDNLFWGCLNRLLLSLGLAAVIGAALTTPQEKMLKGNALVIFFAIPFIANKVLYAVVRNATSQLGALIPGLKEATGGSTLQDIEGINIWKEYRLEEEGIEEVQNLATADVIDLAVKTHYNLRTLIDWVDQALVLARFAGRAEKLRKSGVNVSAVELASQAPENVGAAEYISKLAAVMDIDATVLHVQLKSMFEDEYLQTLWTLWQTRPETEFGARAMSA